MYCFLWYVVFNIYIEINKNIMEDNLFLVYIIFNDEDIKNIEISYMIVLK